MLTSEYKEGNHYRDYLRKDFGMDTENACELMSTFSADNPPTLDIAVLAALQHIGQLQKAGLSSPCLNFDGAARIIGVGSGNGGNTVAILVNPADSNAADESDLADRLAIGSYSHAIVVSASGEKDAPDVIVQLQAKGIVVELLTCDPQSTGAKLADKVTTFPLGREPISYNVLTYLSMVMANTFEQAEDILKYLDKISPLIKAEDFAGRAGFTFIIPARFKIIKDMLAIKFNELFEHHLGFYACTGAFATRHIVSLVQNHKAMYVNLDPDFDLSVLKLKCPHKNIPLPPDCDWGLAYAASYWLVGLIQRANEPWFAQSVVDYCAETGRQPIVQ